MWYTKKSKNPIVRLALLLTLASTPIITSLLKSDYVAAQAATETLFPLPTAVPNGTTVRVDGSTSMSRANESLKQRFEKEYSGTIVELASNGTNDALQALQEGKIDIAAIGRGLTPEEEKQGLEQQRLRREKIAIVVGKDNPFKGDLTNQQFTKIYRGEITDWSELGRTPGKIRVIDRPDISDTREAFRNYPLFKGDLFKTGSTATQLGNDDPAEVVKQLGDDGIGFVLANQVSKLDNVRILSMHKTLPDNPKYPYSQPLVYVFKKNPSEAVKNFVGFATATPGQEAIQAASEQEALAVAQTVTQSVPGGANVTATPGVTANLVTVPTPGSTTAATATTDGKTANNGTVTEGVGTATNTSASENENSGNQAFVPGDSAGVSAEAAESRIPWWWILLPVAALGALVLWWLLGRRKSQEDDTVARGVLPDNSPPPFTPHSTSASSAVAEPLERMPFEPGASGINTTPVESGTSGINTTGLGLGALGVAGLGAAAYRNQQDTNNDVRENFANEYSSELHLDAPDLQQPDIPDTSLDLEAPAAVVNNSYPSLPRISTPTDQEVLSTPVDDTDETNTGLEISSQEELPSTSTTSWLGNFALGGAAAAGAARIKSKLAGKDVAETVDDSAVIDQAAIVDETAKVDQTTEYSQLPDAWETPETSVDAEVTTSDYETLDGSNTTEIEPVEVQPQITQSPSDLWGPETEQPQNNNDQPNTSFSVGGAVAGAAALGGIGALGSGLWNRDRDTSETDNNQQVNQETSASDLWGTPETEPTTTEEPQATSNAGNLGSKWFLNHFRLDQNNGDRHSDSAERDENEQQPQLSEAQLSNPSTSDLPEVRIISASEQLVDAPETTPEAQIPTNTDGLPNVWVTQPTTSKETTSEEQVAQFGMSSAEATSIPQADYLEGVETEEAPEETNFTSIAGATVLGAGAFALGSQILDNQEASPEDENLVTTEPSASFVSFSEDIALDRIADEAEVSVEEIDPEMPTSESESDEGDTAWDRIYGIHHNGIAGVPGESNILLANRTPKWAYASWNIAAEHKEAMQNRGVNQLILRLYDVTNIDLSYQDAKLVQQYECETTVSHRYVAVPNTDRDYVAEIGYLSKDKEWLLISRSPIIRVFSRPHKDFWFEADAELIIHGATEPGSTVTIDGQNIKVKQDGTFHLRVPFTESTINYLITAVAPNSEEARTIHMQFSQKERENG